MDFIKYQIEISRKRTYTGIKISQSGKSCAIKKPKIVTAPLRTASKNFNALSSSSPLSKNIIGLFTFLLSFIGIEELYHKKMELISFFII